MTNLPTTKNVTKATLAKATSTKIEETPVVSDNNVELVETPVDRIPEGITKQAILKEMAQRYLNVFDEVSKYNEAVLAEKNSEWNASKVLERSKELASPEDASLINEKVKVARDAFEKLAADFAKARKSLIEVTANELGIKLSVVADRDSAIEGPLKEKRKFAMEIGTQLSKIAEFTNDAQASSDVVAFLAKYGMPLIGRDQVSSFGTDGSGSTPKYRVTVAVSKGDTLIESFDGFTKAGQNLTNPKFGYERGKALKADTLRDAWEKAGNSATTVVSPVEFDDNDLHFVITKK